MAMTLAEGPAWLGTTMGVIQVVIGFSIIIFVHELGHFLAAKWVGVRVDRFAIGFGAAVRLAQRPGPYLRQVSQLHRG